jgi:hypothetical protein
MMFYIVQAALEFYFQGMVLVEATIRLEFASVFLRRFQRFGVVIRDYLQKQASFHPFQKRIC